MVQSTSTAEPDDGQRPPPDPAFVARFWSRVAIDERPDRCWPWLGSTRREDGYGTFRNEYGAPDLTHRIAFRLSLGPIPAGRVVRHKKCDNPRCCNPAHLLLGTHAQNVADRVQRARSARRARHGRAKLTEEQAAAALALAGIGWTYERIGLVFNIDPSTVGLLVRGVNWKGMQATG